MTTTAVLKRIDNLETKLTPKEWAIRLADEMRKFPSEDEFHYSILNYSSNEDTPFGKPFFMLNKQAEAQQPKDTGAQYRIARKLRREYQALKTLLIQSNEKIKRKAEIWRLIVSLQKATMRALILQDVVEMQEMEIGGKDLTEHTCDSGFLSMIEDWWPETFKLIAEFFLYDAVVKTIQEKYFDGHSILFCDLEDRLSAVKTVIEDVIVKFNEYLVAMEGKIKIQKYKNPNGTYDTAESLKRFALDIEVTKKHFDQKSIIAGAEAWAKDARDKAIMDFLDEKGKHEEAIGFLWNLAREEIKARQTAQKQFDTIRTVAE